VRLPIIIYMIKSMKVGVTVGLNGRSIEELADRAREIERLGFDSLWVPWALSLDPITALVAIGRETPALELGTAIVPTFPNHPLPLAQRALTAQAALDGRFTLGIGLSHKVVVEERLGLKYERPAAHLEEYLGVLAPLLEGAPVAFHGAQYRVEAALDVKGASQVPLLIAAMGPLMLRLAGRLAGGTITSYVGLRTVEDHVVPTIQAAASSAGRNAPRVVVGLPIALTDEVEDTRERLASLTGFYAAAPAYRAMFEREGVDGPADVAIVGDEALLGASLRRLSDAGATDFLAQIIPAGPSSAARTLEWLADWRATSAPVTRLLR
jgi:5,10-methylenetetrahydromethanopterin reductase